jgi:hypothetical protein
LDQQGRDREELMEPSRRAIAAQKKALEAQALVVSGTPPQAPPRKPKSRMTPSERKAMWIGIAADLYLESRPAS